MPSKWFSKSPGKTDSDDKVWVNPLHQAHSTPMDTKTSPGPSTATTKETIIRQGEKTESTKDDNDNDDVILTPTDDALPTLNNDEVSTLSLKLKRYRSVQYYTLVSVSFLLFISPSPETKVKFHSSVLFSTDRCVKIGIFL